MSHDNDPADLLPDDDIHHYFVYDPNWGACIFFIVLFAALTVALLWQAERARPKQRWLHALTIMAAMECGGYIARIVLYAQPGGDPFKAELIILILAPNLLALTCYVVLGKLITYAFHTRMTAAKSFDNWIIRHPLWIPRFYVASDLLCIVIQAIGGALLSSATTQSQDDTAKHIEVAGLALQLFFVATFVLICLYVWLQVRQHEPSILAEVTPSYWCLFGLITLLVMRNAYRTAEFASGTFTSGYLQQDEAWYIVWDPVLMSIALIAAFAFDFTRRLPADCLNAPSSDTAAASKEADIEMGSAAGMKSPHSSTVTVNGRVQESVFEHESGEDGVQ